MLLRLDVDPDDGAGAATRELVDWVRARASVERGTLSTDENRPLAWCVVANVDVSTNGTRGSMPATARSGTRYFSAGTKVWVLPPQWGDGGEDLFVVGRHRGQPGGLVRMVLPRGGLRASSEPSRSLAQPWRRSCRSPGGTTRPERRAGSSERRPSGSRGTGLRLATRTDPAVLVSAEQWPAFDPEAAVDRVIGWRGGLSTLTNSTVCGRGSVRSACLPSRAADRLGGGVLRSTTSRRAIPGPGVQDRSPGPRLLDQLEPTKWRSNARLNMIPVHETVEDWEWDR